MYLLYDLLLLIAAVFLVPFYLLRNFRYGKSRLGLRERFGYLSEERLQLLQNRKVLWIHAVSVGETRAAEPLLKEFRQRYPEHLLLLTNVTESGHAMGMENQNVDCCMFFPFDFSWVVRRILKVINPDLVVIVETEIWPNFVHQANLLEIPLVLVNGRISDRSYPRYRFFRPLLRSVLQYFSAFCMQSQLDSERIGQLGAESLRVRNTGNLKFDHELRNLSDDEVQALQASFCLPDDLPIFVAGSTHAGEESQLLEVYQALLEQDRQLGLVLIPRHPERCREVQSLLAEKGIEYRLRSGLEAGQPVLTSGQVLLVDTLGEVLDLYAVSDLVFVGGSLVPIGGHNLLEACLLGKPVLFGPHVQNFRVISEKLIRAGAGVKVMNQRELIKQSAVMLDDPIRRRAMGQAGSSLIAENAGATERTMDFISRYVKD